MPNFHDIVPRLAEQAIELPSWAFGNSGTRFKVFTQPGDVQALLFVSSQSNCTHLYPTTLLTTSPGGR